MYDRLQIIANLMISVIDCEDILIILYIETIMKREREKKAKTPHKTPVYFRPSLTTIKIIIQECQKQKAFHTTILTNDINYVCDTYEDY